MKLFLLRHEKRPLDNPEFFTKLTEQGLEDTTNITKKLYDKNINIDFCSPFIRTIQTIQDYVINNNLQINIENSLYESLQTDNFKNIQNYSLNDINLNDYNFKNINNEYKSLLDIDEISFPDTFDKVKNRVDNFISFLFDNYQDKNILLCSHQYILQYIELKINYLNKNYNFDQDIKKKLFDIEFNMGQIKEFNF